MEEDKKDPFNTGYLIALILVLLIPIMPATLTWFEIWSR